MPNDVYIDILKASIRKNASLPCLHRKKNGRYASWTYESFGEDCNRLSTYLTRLGVKAGVNAAVIGENLPEWIIAFHAIIMTGGCVVPIDPNLPPEEIETIVTTTEIRVVFCSPLYAPLFRELARRHTFLRHIILLEPDIESKLDSVRDCTGNYKIRQEAPQHTFRPDDPMVIIFTSGTTGAAKGVVLTQRNFSTVGNYAPVRMRISAEDTVCAVLPLHHVFGCAASVVAPLAVGMDIVLVPSIKAPLILEALNDKQVTFLPAVPKMLQMFFDGILHKVKKQGPVVAALFSLLRTVSSVAGPILGTRFRRMLFAGVHRGFGGKLQLIISGGAPLEADCWHGFSQLGFTIVEGYGLSETFGPITVCPDSHPRLGSVGPILPDNEIRIIDASKDGVGEVLLRGACIFKGYSRNDELTAQVLDKNGWLHTGDLGRLDRNGYLYLSGRKKDMIVLDSGKNVYPDELEAYYGSSPLIEEIAVFGSRHSGREIVAAVIVPQQLLRRGKSPQQQTEMIQNELLRLGKKVPAYRRINDFSLSPVELPRTTTRKFKKNEIREYYLSLRKSGGRRSLSDVKLSVIEKTMMDSREFNLLLDDICTVAPRVERKAITPRTNLFVELGLDSMDRIELLAALEQRYGMTIGDAVFDKIESMGDLVRLIEDIRPKK